MTALIIGLIVIVVVAFLLQASKQQAKNEVTAQGGLRNIFKNLDSALRDQEFVFANDNISTVEYINEINKQSYIKLVLKKNLDLKTPYEIQMFHIMNGQTKKKTIPYIVFPEQTYQQFKDNILKMGEDILQQLADDVAPTFLKS